MHKGTLIVNLPNRPKDDEVEVFPYGMFKNGYGYEVPLLKGPKFDPDTGLTEFVDVDELIIGDKEAKPPVIEIVEEDESPLTPPVKSDDTGAEAPTDPEGGE